MPQDFDVDKFMAERRKAQPAPAQAAPAAPSFDVDAFMQERRGGKAAQKPASVSRPAAPQAIRPETTSGPLYESLQDQNRRGVEARQAERQRKQAEFEAKPLATQWYERAKDALSRGVEPVMNAMTTGPSIASIPSLFRSRQARATGEKALADWRTQRTRELAERQANRPEGGLLTQAGEGVLEAIPSAVLLAATGGEGALPMALSGGGFTAGSIPAEQWRQAPGRSAIQVASSAVAPVIGGRIGQKVGGAVANRLANPAAQAVSRAGGEVLGGAAGNVGATGAEQLAFEGKLNPRQLVKSGIVGGALAAPGAIGAAGRSLPPAAKVPQFRTPEGAIMAQPSSQELNPEAFGYISGRKLLPPGNPNEVPTERLTPQTRPIPIPDAPITQEMPEIGQRIALENAPTTEQPIAAPRQTRELPRREATTALLPRSSGPTLNAITPQVSPEIPPKMAESGTALSRPRTERLSVPKATDENIQTLRTRQEELGRLAYDRRGDFTGDLRDEYNQITAHIRDYENARAPREIGEPPGMRPEAGPNPAEREARRGALATRPETGAVGRPVTQEVQIPGLKKAETFSSREDARQGHFERFDDQELVDEINRMQEIQNQAVRGRSKLTPEQLEANRFDLKVAVEQQKERGRLQRQIGIEPANRIAPRTPSRSPRKIQHSTLGEVTEAENQKGVPAGKLRVTGEDGDHIIQNPRTRGNTQAAFVRSIPAEAMPEMTAPGAPKAPEVGNQKAPTKINYTIPEEAAPELSRKSRGHVMGSLFGGLGGGGKLPSRTELSETAGGIQTAAQLGNPKFVIRNILQHVAFGKQERTATRLAATIDWAYSKATGKPRQIAAPRGSDLKAYVANWRKAVKAYKSGQALPGGNSPIQPTANANVVDKAVGKLMTYINEIPDSANWQTRFGDSLQSIVRKNPSANRAEAIEQAKLEADRASLRDKNFASNALQKLKEGLNTLSSPVFGSEKFGVGDFIVKYAKTPGALLKRGLERSPLGLFEVAKQAATPGPFRRRNTLLALSRVAEGAATGLGLGAGLAAAGVLVGPEEDKKTGRGFEREEGVRGYSLNASVLGRMLGGDFSGEMHEGDQLYSIDWLQPWAMNLSAGAALWGLHKDGKLGVKEGGKATGEAIYNSLSKTLDVMGDQSVLKNLSRYLDKASGETFSDKMYNFAKAVGLDVPSSFVPSLARQTRQVVDPYERDTRPDQRGGVKGFAKEAFGRAAAQIPGVSSRFPTRPSLLTGEDRKTAIGEMSMAGRIASQFSPANVSTYTPRPVAQEISRLNKAGEKVSVNFPAPITNKRTGERESTSSLRGRERRFAETWSRMSQELIEDAFYKDADNETKAAAWNGLKRHLSGMGKEDFEEKSTEEIIESAMETVEKRREKEEK